MNRDKLLTIRVTDEEMNRLRELTGESTISEYVLSQAFKGRRESRVDSLPGWEVVERNRRDGGIKVVHERFSQPKIIYPEDKVYEDI